MLHCRGTFDKLLLLIRVYMTVSFLILVVQHACITLMRVILFTVRFLVLSVHVLNMEYSSRRHLCVGITTCMSLNEADLTDERKFRMHFCTSTYKRFTKLST